MDISNATLWWIAAGTAVAVELATGTFYLLMVALGLASAAAAAHLGLAGSTQVTVAALVGSGATALWHWKRMHAPTSLPARENRDVNFDVGETVHVNAWSAERTTQVAYRGSSWTAHLQPGCAAAPGAHEVVAVEGNWLVVRPTLPT
jgi:membrane protein implicated in regulation of membrane protease activity